MSADPEEMSGRVTEVCGRMGAHLAGMPPRFQAVVLCDLVATWLAQFAAGPKRDDATNEMFRAIRSLIPIHASLLRTDKQDAETPNS